MPGRPTRTQVLALLAAAVALVALPLRASAGTVTSPNGPAPVDMNYVYSLLDDTNQSTSLSDGKSWAVRYYHRETGLAGDTQATNPHPCQLDATTGKNSFAAGGTDDTGASPTFEDCWWEFMNAWKAEAASEPGLSGANVQDHFFHLGEMDPEPYVSNPAANQSSQPGPFDVVTLTIPGAVHPEQTVVIGEHPDGAQLSSFGSAFDDAQGAAEILGVARSMMQYWQSTNQWPARTVQFVLFDGEEEGLYGSFFYQNQMVPVGSIDSNALAGMLNVDQNGIEYPARHLGTPDKPDQGPWYTNIQMTPVQDCTFYGTGPSLADCPARIQDNQPAIQAFHTETNADIEKTYDELGQVYAGQPMPLADYGINTGLYPSDCITAAQTSNLQDVNCAQTFQDWSNDQQYFLSVDDNSGGTDQDPFVRCGVPAWGIFGAWDNSPQEPLQNNPTGNIDVPYAGYDTPVDNMAWLNALASGKPAPATGVDVSPPNEIDPYNPVTNPRGEIGSEALRRGLAFAADLTLNEATDPQMAGVAPLPTDPIAYFSADRWAEKAGATDTFDAIPSPVPASSWAWSFDDGATATGPVVTHAFAAAGVHKVTLTESGAGGSSTYSASVNVVAAGGDPNTQCGTPATLTSAQAAALTPSFTNNAPQAALAESPLSPALLGMAAVAALLDAGRRRARRRRLAA